MELAAAGSLSCYASEASAFDCVHTGRAASDGGRILGGDFVTTHAFAAARSAVVVVGRRRARAFHLALLAVHLRVNGEGYATLVNHGGVRTHLGLDGLFG